MRGTGSLSGGQTGKVTGVRYLYDMPIMPDMSQADCLRKAGTCHSTDKTCMAIFSNGILRKVPSFAQKVLGSGSA